MNNFKDKVAVITGGANGIGLGIAKKCLEKDMKTIIADIDKEAIKKAKVLLKKEGRDLITKLVDVSNPKNVKELVEYAFKMYKEVNLLCLNAGVSVRMPLWEQTLNDWHWIIGVNLMGIVHGIKFFVPYLLDQESESHIVITASIMGLMQGSDTYSVIKHAVVALSEALYGQLRSKSKKIKVSVLCPAFINTDILDSERNRPEHLQNGPNEIIITPEMEANEKAMRKMIEAGLNPEKVGEIIFKAIENEQFYILTDDSRRFKNSVKLRMKNILKAFET